MSTLMMAMTKKVMTMASVLVGLLLVIAMMVCKRSRDLKMTMVM